MQQQKITSNLQGFTWSIDAKSTIKVNEKFHQSLHPKIKEVTYEPLEETKEPKSYAKFFMLYAVTMIALYSIGALVIYAVTKGF